MAEGHPLALYPSAIVNCQGFGATKPEATLGKRYGAFGSLDKPVERMALRVFEAKAVRAGLLDDFLVAEADPYGDRIMLVGGIGLDDPSSDSANFSRKHGHSPQANMIRCRGASSAGWETGR